MSSILRNVVRCISYTAFNASRHVGEAWCQSVLYQLEKLKKKKSRPVCLRALVFLRDYFYLEMSIKVMPCMQDQNCKPFKT